VESPRRQPAALRLGVDGAVRVWVNGVEVYADDAERSAVPDRDATGVVLERGRNRVLVKSCSGDGGWQVLLRLTRPDGTPLVGARVDASAPAVAAAAPRGSAPSAVPSLWRWFWERVGGEGGAAPAPGADVPPVPGEPGTSVEVGASTARPGVPAAAWFDLATFLVHFGGDDPDAHVARDAAEAAVALEPSVDNLRLLARVHADRNVRLDALRRAVAADPARVATLLALAGELAAGATPDDAAVLVERAAQLEPSNPFVALARADLLESVGLTHTALRLARAELAARETGRALSVVRSLAHEAGDGALEEQVAERFFRTHATSASLRVELARRRTDRGEHDAALALLRDGLTFAPWDADLRLQLAATLESAGDAGLAGEALRAASDIRPGDARLHEELARFHDRGGRTVEAVAAARRSLERRPENPWLRQWLEVFERADRFEAPYVEESAVFLARRGGGRGHDVHVLLDLEVRNVHRSGQSDEYRQLVFEALSLEGARALSRYQVVFTPHRQRLHVERARVHRADGTTREAVSRTTQDVYDASIRMYYDLRATTLGFGDVQPGDVVEVRYRISDVGDANELGTYFGGLTLFQTTSPAARVAYVLLAPADRELRFDEPDPARVRHSSRTVGDAVEHVYEALDVAPVSVEAGMPPLTEVAPRLHVSTFSSWDELGRWYWNLVRDQLELDAGQRANAERLVRGQTDDLGRVRAIHRHVVQSVRYVALELGVHRFKPYRVSDVERRGFGDCKDQASLMIAMLEHVGVDAEIVLLRTRHLGRIPTSPPSLEVFNHAIVYVPSLGFYIDPTAERVAVGDLPSADQGVMALRVDEDTVVLETTPLVEPERQTREMTLRVALSPDGAVRGRLVMRTTGWIAGLTRSALDDEANRVSYLERLLSQYVRGIAVSNVAATDVTELDTDTEAAMDIVAPAFARREGDVLSVPLSIATSLTGLVSQPTREQDLVFGPPIGWVESLDIALPSGLTPAELPEPVTIESPIATFRLAVTRAPAGALQVRSSLLWRAERITPGDYPALRDLVERVTAARTARVRLVSQ
jgi:tetratricopeptide (TPR) repeat protein